MLSDGVQGIVAPLTEPDEARPRNRHREAGHETPISAAG